MLAFKKSIFFDVKGRKYLTFKHDIKSRFFIVVVMFCCLSFLLDKIRTKIDIKIFFVKNKNETYL